ncbi:hypothetical protein ABID41_003667 [Phenylobacterium koreense]|uniref:Uncharacterized protein n=1 Tax=Phenylobacterium koreense TaxID=266125 RepID=A0ABV2EN91_9CAUL
MLHRLHHVFFHRAHGNTELIGDLPRFSPLKAMQDKNPTCARRETKQGFGGCAKLLLARQDAIGVEILFGMTLGVEYYVGVGLAREAATSSIGEHAGGDLEDKASEMLNGLIAVASDDPGEDLLNKIVDLGGIWDPPSEILRQPLA